MPDPKAWPGGAVALMEEMFDEMIEERIKHLTPDMLPRFVGPSLKAKAATYFEAVVDAAKQVCNTRGTGVHVSTAYAKRIRKAVDAIVRARGMGMKKPVGIGIIKRALSVVQERNQKINGSAL
jgi:hypothetical protein